MSKWVFVAVLISLAWSVSETGYGQRSSATSSFLQDGSLLHGTLVQEQVKECAVVFPVPDAQAKWKNCQELESTECGGPPGKCTCRDAERLVTYKCDGGTYKSCEYDPGCVNGS